MTSDQLLEFADRAILRGVQGLCLDGLKRSCDCFGARLHRDLVSSLDVPEQKQTFSSRYARSNLGLLVDDWKALANWQSRQNLVRELFLPSHASLMNKYGKEDVRWLPLLWIRQVVGGLAQRLSLR